MNNGLLFSVTNTIDTYVYRGLLQLNDVGRSSAAGFLQSILGFVLVMITNMITRKIDKVKRVVLIIRERDDTMITTSKSAKIIPHIVLIILTLVCLLPLLLC